MSRRHPRPALPAGGSGKVTLHMVAAEAGVSASTVSKVLNGRVDVSAETKERVAAVMDSLGYRRRPARRAGTAVELVLNEIDSLWSVEIIQGVEETLRAAGATLVLSAVHGRDADTRQWLDGLAARRSSGAILVVAALTPHQGRRLTALDVPLVLMLPGHRPWKTRSVALKPNQSAPVWSMGAPAAAATGMAGGRRRPCADSRRLYR
ncbi:LacI family DNA-binding transcriptional regulator [Streptomyces sp. NPDC048182]|uniref:LacI family DNA-binding transcriptional regulator n=1 Tax=Streptomyces sp. NPDC048182 TaxID=3365507 RepID=UPI00372012DD